MNVALFLGFEYSVKPNLPCWLAVIEPQRCFRRWTNGRRTRFNPNTGETSATTALAPHLTEERYDNLIALCGTGDEANKVFLLQQKPTDELAYQVRLQDIYL